MKDRESVERRSVRFQRSMSQRYLIDVGQIAAIDIMLRFGYADSRRATVRS